MNKEGYYKILVKIAPFLIIGFLSFTILNYFMILKGANNTLFSFNGWPFTSVIVHNDNIQIIPINFILDVLIWAVSLGLSISLLYNAFLKKVDEP